MAVHELCTATRDWLAHPVPFRVNGAPMRCNAPRDLINPATGKVFGQVHKANAAHVDEAVSAARAAFESPGWAAMNPSMRARIMWRLADLIDTYAEQLGELETLSMGKPFAAAWQMEVPFFAETFRYFAGWCTKITGQAGPLSFPAGDLHGITLLEPAGVVGMILPWNGPLVIAGWKIAPAIATGCTCVIKPADITPLSLLRFAELAREAGIPDGVLNIVTGPGAITGAAIARHGGIDKLAFTGSARTGRGLVHASADSNLKSLSLELGGKSPVVVFADADLDAAIAGAADAIFGNSGQVCVAGSRLYVEASIFEAFMERLVAHTENLKSGDPFDSTTDLGPLSSKAHCDSVAARVAAGVASGAALLCGGTARDAFFSATILEVADQSNPLVCEEIFGPVLTVHRFSDEKEAIMLANGTDYALAGSVWTRDIDRALRMVRAIHAGIVWVNTHNIPDLHMPVGGRGQSGWGRELGQLGLSEYLDVKSAMIAISPAPDSARSAI